MVRFTELDGYILWSLPVNGCGLTQLVHAYTFVNRAAAPSYSELADCLRRSVLAGVLSVPTNDHYELTVEWRQQICRWNGAFPVSEDSMIAFSEWLVSREWPVIFPAGYELGRKQYEVATVGYSIRA